jgi:hypothetical protein
MAPFIPVTSLSSSGPNAGWRKWMYCVSHMRSCSQLARCLVNKNVY